MKYTITIKDNETGKVILDDQTDSIIGAIDQEDTTMPEMTSLEALEAIKEWIKCFVRFDYVLEFEIIERDLKKLEEVKQWVKSFEYQRP